MGLFSWHNQTRPALRLTASSDPHKSPSSSTGAQLGDAVSYEGRCRATAAQRRSRLSTSRLPASQRPTWPPSEANGAADGPARLW